MIHNRTELEQFIADHPQRHQQVSTIECSCGWGTDDFPVPPGTVTWSQHSDAILLQELAENLPSNSSIVNENGELETQSWPDLVEDLYAAIDNDRD